MTETAGVRITVRDDGNLKVEGPVTIVDPTGAAFALEPGKPVFLCRCGQSATKPFCDGAHRTAGFQSVCRAEAATETGS